MGEWLLPLIIVVAFLVVGPILGTIAFFRVRTLNRELQELRAAMSGAGTLTADAVVTLEPRSAPDQPSEPEPHPAQDEKPGSLEDEERSEPVETPEEDPDEELPKAARVDEAAARYDDGAGAGRFLPGFAGGAKLEETIGAKWAVWVGGIALALGAVFLVRYTIEQGLLGPRERILLGLIFSVGLCAIGEYTRPARRGIFHRRL